MTITEKLRYDIQVTERNYQKEPYYKYYEVSFKIYDDALAALLRRRLVDGKDEIPEDRPEKGYWPLLTIVAVNPATKGIIETLQQHGKMDSGMSDQRYYAAALIKSLADLLWD